MRGWCEFVLSLFTINKPFYYFSSCIWKSSL
jgi:hypothetical protein